MLAPPWWPLGKLLSGRSCRHAAQVEELLDAVGARRELLLRGELEEQVADPLIWLEAVEDGIGTDQRHPPNERGIGRRGGAIGLKALEVAILGLGELGHQLAC